MQGRCLDKELDYAKTRSFWENRYKRKTAAGALYVANLSENIPLQAVFKDMLEKEIISRNVSLTAGLDVLDLGCGSGRMTIFFAQRCGKAVGVDFSGGLLRIAIENSRPLGLGNLIFIQQRVEHFLSRHKFDIIFIGGVLSYLNDQEIEEVLSNVKQMLKAGGRLIVRESLSQRRRCVIGGEYQDNFKDNYSVIYRSVKEFNFWLKKHNFFLVYEDSLSIFPFMGLYHFIIRKLFRANNLYFSLSRGYFRLALRLRPYLQQYRRSLFSKLLSYLANRYNQELFIYSLR